MEWYSKPAWLRATVYGASGWAAFGHSVLYFCRKKTESYITTRQLIYKSRQLQLMNSWTFYLPGALQATHLRAVQVQAAHPPKVVAFYCLRATACHLSPEQCIIQQRSSNPVPCTWSSVVHYLLWAKWSHWSGLLCFNLSSSIMVDGYTDPTCSDQYCLRQSDYLWLGLMFNLFMISKIF